MSEGIMESNQHGYRENLKGLAELEQLVLIYDSISSKTIKKLLKEEKAKQKNLCIECEKKLRLENGI